MNARVPQAEQALALHVAGYAPANWVRFVANVELDEDCCDSISLFIVQDGQELSKIDAGDPAHGRRFHGLLDPVREVWVAYGRTWKVADVVVDFTGDYSIRYGYEYRRLAEPMDMAGVTVLRDYIARFAADIPRR
jgi:hypothetical protein